MSGQVPVEEPPPSYEETISGGGGTIAPPLGVNVSTGEPPLHHPGDGKVPPRVEPATTGHPYRNRPSFASTSTSSSIAGPAAAAARQQHYQQQQARLHEQQRSQNGSNGPRQFPPKFAVYVDNPSSRTYTLGEHLDQPLYSVKINSQPRLPTSSAGPQLPALVLHNGPDAETSGVLASVDFVANASSHSHMMVTLPAALHSSSTSALPSQARVDCKKGWHRTYTFAVEVGPAQTLETFEWRHSHGAAVDALDGEFDGWKLLRREKGPPPGFVAHEGQDGWKPGPYAASDGLELVAAWSDVRMSISKQAKFAFVGTGGSGLLGERWAVMAVSSGLGIWEREKRRKRRKTAA